jgi:hypothetical protein
MDQETEWPGNNGSFRVKLASQPTAPVKIRLRSDSTEQGIPDKSTLVFTPDKFGKGGWNRWQIVTVKAQPGGAAAGNIAYTIVTDQAVSKDKKYAVLDPDDVPMVNHVAGPGVTLEVTDPTTSSSGGTGTFRAHLNSRPALNTTVTIVLTDDNPEGKVVLPTTKEFVFNSTNWWKWQMATVKGQQSGNEGLHPFTIVTSNTISNDPKYKDLDVLDADMVNEVVVRPGPWTVWVADTGGYDVVDSRRSHLIDTAHNKKIGKYADDQFVTLFSENSITKIAEEAYWKYRANSRWYYEYGFMVNLSGNVLRNGVAVYLSDHPWQQSADAAIASMGWRRPLSDEKDEPGGLLRPLAVDAALSAAL